MRYVYFIDKRFGDNTFERHILYPLEGPGESIVYEDDGPIKTNVACVFLAKDPMAVDPDSITVYSQEREPAFRLFNKIRMIFEHCSANVIAISHIIDELDLPPSTHQQPPRPRTGSYTPPQNVVTTPPPPTSLSESTNDRPKATTTTPPPNVEPSPSALRHGRTSDEPREKDWMG
ncbi:MAG: hypothetical protein JSW58_08600 [Candidatus Latescibacterota bacterium]|nr:MAG: hypothetical protein JSW58_08600 [Candidatus Latescibacterota bacterium]